MNSNDDFDVFDKGSVLMKMARDLQWLVTAARHRFNILLQYILE